MQRRIGSGYYNPIIQYVAEMSGCENRLFFDSRTLRFRSPDPVGRRRREAGAESEKNRIPHPPGRPHAPFATALLPGRPPAPFATAPLPADRPAYRSPAVRFMICFFPEGMPLIILCDLSNNTKVRLYHCHLARSRLKSRIIYFNWRIHLQFSCIIDSFYAKVLT